MRVGVGGGGTERGRDGVLTVGAGVRGIMHAPFLFVCHYDALGCSF